MNVPCLTPTTRMPVIRTAPPLLAPAQCGDCGAGLDVPVRCCAECAPIVFICNSNAITDDTWDLLLGGTLVGQHMAGMEARATVVIPQAIAAAPLTGLVGRSCTIFSTIATPLLDAPGTTIVLTMRLAAKMGSGNFGSVQILCGRRLADGSTLVLPQPGGTFTYTNPNPYVIGARVTYRLRWSTGG